MTELLIFRIIEILGTVAFAISGSLAAVGAGLDIFGVVFTGCVTAFGGGILRDIITGNVPPRIFSDFPLFAFALITSVSVFVISYMKRKTFGSMREKIERINNFFDALGLAAFSVMGCTASLSAFPGNGFLAVSMGMLTGIGGGIIRDLLLDSTPYVFKKHVYALASIAGSALYFLLTVYYIPEIYATVISFTLVVALRLLATKFRWELPKIKIK